MKKIKILVASHKPDNVYQDQVYTPIHVGRSISEYKDEMAGMIGDNTGDNISEKNKSYCELTAIYWAWKNLKNEDYIGLAHYRRYFETRFTEENIEKIFSNYDVVLAQPMLRDTTNESKLSKILLMEDVSILLSVMQDKYPEYEEIFMKYLYGYEEICYNMLIAPRAIFEDYCKFLFTVLGECERQMKSIPYTYSQRRMGYIAEFLTPIFFLQNNMKIRYEPIVSMIGEKAQKRKLNLFLRLRILFLKILYRGQHSYQYMNLKRTVPNP